MWLALALLLSFARADYAACDDFFGPQDLCEFLTHYEVEYADLKSLVVICPYGDSPLNLLAYLEETRNKQLIVRLRWDIQFHSSEACVYTWPDVRGLFFEISRIGLTPGALKELALLDCAGWR